MAIVKNNIVTKGFSGMFGRDIVFKNLRGKTIATKPAKPVPASKQSERQRQNRNRFREATEYAHLMMDDPAKKEYYRRKAKKLKLPNAYTAAITDYLRKLTVKQVTVVRSKSRSHPGNTVVINAIKKGFAPASVDIRIMDEQGTVLESGKATSKDGWQGWLYQPMVALEKNMRLVVTVTDNPGHEVAVTGFIDTGCRVVLQRTA